MMGFRNGLVVALGLAAGLALVPRAAQACACCGQEQWVKVLGWSDSGREVALHRTTDATCNTQEVLEIWEVGEDAPTTCFDAYGEDPTKAVPCTEIEGVDPNWANVPDPGKVVTPPGFTTPASSVSARYLMLWGRSDEDSFESQFDLEVYVPRGDGGAFLPVDRAERRVEYDEAISVWPAPKGRAALLLAKPGDWTDERPIAVAWAKLPRRFDRAVLGDTPSAVTPDKPPRAPHPDDGPDDDDGHHDAAKILARARVYERIGDRARASRLCAAAAASDPAFMEAWINAARHRIALGNPEWGVAVLGRLLRLKCPSCEAELRAGLDHADFDSVRSDPAFRALGGRR